MKVREMEGKGRDAVTRRRRYREKEEGRKISGRSRGRGKTR